MENRAEREIGRYFELATARRPSEELFDVLADPGCLRDLARDAAHAETLAALRGRMDAFLRETADPRSTGEGYIWETYKRYSPIRQFPMPDGADRPGY
ncbi:MAG: hypothetical protein BWZ10_00444 [candidate division BRC1 bacterium ADurb.BinA364]|nr:MAG: hypothetical protein BWZ10_00444 [candidate division BRC1 bacterium ADurb.BinA364]